MSKDKKTTQQWVIKTVSNEALNLYLFEECLKQAMNGMTIFKAISKNGTDVICEEIKVIGIINK